MPKLPALWERPVQGPRTHALVVGASDYANLPPVGKAGGPETLDLKRLRCAALSAWRIQQWLYNAADELERPLASIRTLMSPSPEEIAAEPDLPTDYPRPTFAEFAKAAKAWRKAAKNDDDVTILYFAGHGLQADNTSPLLVLDDFADGVGGTYENTVRLQNIIDGMAPSQETPMIAQTQYYFVDACRNTPPAMKAARSIDSRSVFNDLNDRDERSLAIFHATTFGDEAAGIAGKTTNFCAALLTALELSSDRSEGSGPNKRWIVTADMLKQGILDALADAKLPANAPLTQSGSREMVVRRLTKAPEVELAIKIAPDDCIPTTQVEIRDGRFQLVKTFPENGAQHPYAPRVPMGIYVLTARPPDPYKPFEGEPVEITFRRNFDWPLDFKP